MEGMNLRIWCLGNALLGDDAVGLRVAELLLERGAEKNADVVDCGITPENHVASLRKKPPSALLVVDAADMGLAPGELRALSLEELDAAAVTSHGVPLSLLLSPFAGVFEIAVLGIQPEATRLGAPLSETAEKAARRVASLIESGEWRTVQKLSMER